MLPYVIKNLGFLINTPFKSSFFSYIKTIYYVGYSRDLQLVAKEACDYDFSDVGSVRAPTADHHKHHHPCLQTQHKDKSVRTQKRDDGQDQEPKRLAFS